MALESADEVRSPDWWLLRLGRQLRDRQPQLVGWWDYYRGEHPLPQGPRRATEAYRDFQQKSRTNFCAAVADASVDRLQVIGLTDIDGELDAEAWRWWRLNRLNARQKQIYRAAMALSVSYVIVGPYPGQAERPLVTAEHPREVIVDEDPASGIRDAGLKAWYDPIGRVGRATVYLADQLIRYETDKRGPGPLPWGEAAWTETGRQGHELGEVPVVPFECRPFVGEDPVAEFAGVIDIQDRVNLGVLNRMTAERYSAFRQKWVRGHKFKKKVDTETGLEVVEQPFVPDPGALWATEFPDAQFGDFAATDLMGYLRAHEMDIRDLLILSRTPAYYYAGDLVNISADTINALDTLHVSKVGEHQENFAERWETVAQLMARVAGSDREDGATEVLWRDPRHLNPAVVADAAVKKKSIGFPLGILAEDMGESPQRVQRILSESAADQLAGAAALALAEQARGTVPTINPADTGGEGGGDGGA